MALFPAISVLISVYGLAFNVVAVEQQLLVLRELLPAPAFTLITERVHELVTQPNGTLSISLLISLRRHVLECRDRHEVGHLCDQRRVRCEGTARLSRLSAHWPADDAMCRDGRSAGNRGARVRAGGDHIRRPVRLQRLPDQCDQHGAAGGPGRRIDRADVPVRSCTRQAGQPAHLPRCHGGHRAVADRVGRTVVLRLAHRQFRRDLWASRRRGRDHAVVLRFSRTPCCLAPR